ncbi:MAG: histidine kinase [Actinomycetota bacterium]|nr:histidine kinase [Actinomycetota bacterium]
MPRLAERTAGRLTAALWILTALIALAGAVLTVIAWGDLSLGDSVPNLVSAVAGVVYATLGALIVRRVRNVIGWILLGEGFGLAFLSFASGYAVVGIATHPGVFPDPKLVGAIAVLSFIPTSIGLAFMMFVFPTGTLPSPRWRPIIALGLLAIGLTVIGSAFNPRLLGIPAPGGVSLKFPNPLGIASLRHAISTFLVCTTWALVIAIAAAFLALVVRYRSGTRELRQQIKWVAFAAALALFANFVALLALFACNCDQSPVAGAMFYFVAIIVFFGVPAAFAIAILKYGLYQIDVIINRALVYGLLAAALTAVYVGLVIGVGTLVGRRGSSLLTVAAAVAIALLFQPVRRRAQLVANRLVYGERATPYQVLSDFAERMAGTYGLDDVLQRMVSILAAGTGATRVDVWLRVGSELRPVAMWPNDADAPEPIPLPGENEFPPFDHATRAVGVRHGEELLGALALEKPRNEPLSPTEDKLLQDLAAQAGLVLRNVRLTAELQANVEELRASRRRLVEAQDEERRKIERNLHDGAQQQLVALTVQLGLLERLAEDPARVKEMATRLQGALRDALDDLRDLARGIYPPLLADKGLSSALDAQARKAAVTTTVEPDGVGRYPQEVEATVYFCALEALQNVAKYAEASSAVVRLSERDGALVFEIQDDGHGFDPDVASYGSGLQGMADRLDAIGGELQVRSAPGSGTTIRGRIRLG